MYTLTSTFETFSQQICNFLFKLQLAFSQTDWMFLYEFHLVESKNYLHHPTTVLLYT